MRKLTNKKRKLRNKVIGWTIIGIVALVIISFSVVQLAYMSFSGQIIQINADTIQVTSVSTKTPVGYMTTSSCPEIEEFEVQSSQHVWNDDTNDWHYCSSYWRECAGNTGRTCDGATITSLGTQQECVAVFTIASGGEPTYSYNPIDHCMQGITSLYLLVKFAQLLL